MLKFIPYIFKKYIKKYNLLNNNNIHVRNYRYVNIF